MYYNYRIENRAYEEPASLRSKRFRRAFPSPSPLLPSVLRSPPSFAPVKCEKRLERAENPAETLATQARNQPPYCLLQLQEKKAFRLPRSGCLGTPLTLPQSLYGRTDVR